MENLPFSWFDDFPSYKPPFSSGIAQLAMFGLLTNSTNHQQSP